MRPPLICAMRLHRARPPRMVRAGQAAGRPGKQLHDTCCTRMRHCRRALCSPVAHGLRAGIGSRACLTGGANVSLTIESDPPGADAKTSLGASCRTPCMIPVAGRPRIHGELFAQRLPAAGHAGAPAHARRIQLSKSRPRRRAAAGRSGAQPGLCAAPAGPASDADQEGPRAREAAPATPKQ